MFRNAPGHVLLALCLLVTSVGCSSTGFSLTPPRHLLTDQAENVVASAPRHVDLPRELNETVLTAHYLQPGDVLLVESVSVDTEVRFPADQKVLADGTIDLGGYGRVIVAGLTLEAAEKLVEQTIENRDGEPAQVNVRLLDSVHRFYVLGEVASPGSYPFVGNEKVLDAIVAAGGLTSQADQCRIILARPTPPPSCRVALPICYREITQLGDTTTNYQLQPGDRIFVASRRLCDDLQFWKAGETCQRCCGCQSQCPDPLVAMFRNPIASILPPAPPLPATAALAAPDGVSNENIQQGQAFDPGLVEEEAALPGPPIRKLTPPAPSNASTPELSGELNFETPIPEIRPAP